MADEETLLARFAASFAHGPDDADDTDPLAAAANTAWQGTQAFLAGLDAIFDAHEASTKAGPYLEQAMIDAENAGDEAGLLTVLNETMGFHRSQGRHRENQWIVQRTMELAARMGLPTSNPEAWSTTLINCATAMRAAGEYLQSEELYRMALQSAETAFSPTDRRLAALHNNLSMLYSETSRAPEARRELETALHILESSSVNPNEDIDVASTHTNLALALLALARDNGEPISSDAPSSATAHIGDGDSLRGTNNADVPDNVDSRNDTSNASDGRIRVDGLLDEAEAHAATALRIYRDGHLEHSAHYASALAGYAQVACARERYGDAADHYRKALAVIEECYGKDTDYYRITESNLRHTEDLARERAEAASAVPSTAAPSTPNAVSVISSGPSSVMLSGVEASQRSLDFARDDEGRRNHDDERTHIHSEGETHNHDGGGTRIRGLELARQYWLAYGKPLIAERYPEYQGRIAAGLVGHGSECYGFDDELSHDHDFGPRFCLWLTDEDYDAIGERLQADYDALPQEFLGYGPRESTSRAQGADRRDGVFRIGDFFESITGYRQAPSASAPHEWLMLDEATLAAATNGQVFADPLGEFSKTRQGFKLIPEDVRLALISKRLGMIAQAGQYNLPRSLARGDGAAAWLSIQEFVEAASSLVFLLNEPVSAGYMPYYKWQFAALRRLSSRMATRLPDICEQLESILRLSSAACFGGAGFGEGGKGAAPAIETINATVEHICGQIVAQLRREGLTNSDETFLEWQRPYVEEHIADSSPCLHSL
ncbi:tetratricopeptide repeat protein [Bifidobacterium lemurum]|uniref:Tetratricopeptide repeat protein n=1 Tax=Bifidobacterium lemurum TaxID=1603886 RepID=A0A261FVF5_9BIFI|nr:DUF4037 domain-containing protein [Bifidobacterium lemurum]OZG63167.1 tetratricopeptide repeat protein [Bifidobacterium lemurum]QOL33492.1 DUF4037 domain-containing protein [Bifidobacterium lemurum]